MVFISGLIAEPAQLGCRADVHKSDPRVEAPDRLQNVDHPAAIHIQIYPRFAHGKWMGCGCGTIENDVFPGDLLTDLAEIEDVLEMDLQIFLNVLDVKEVSSRPRVQAIIDRHPGPQVKAHAGQIASDETQSPCDENPLPFRSCVVACCIGVLLTFPGFFEFPSKRNPFGIPKILTPWKVDSAIRDIVSIGVFGGKSFLEARIGREAR